MTKIPYISEPQQQESNLLVNSVSTKSRFKSLFQWHKNIQTLERPFTRNGPESASQSLGNGLRPQLSPRTYSENTALSKPVRLHSSDGPRCRPRERILTDPPPLTQAYRQALVHADLETPVSFTEVVRSRQNSLSAKDAQSQDVLEDVVKVKCAHKKTDSGDDTCVTKSKIFVLVHGPYLLQFSGDAEPNTLPEKILLLDKDCVAFACDAVPGRPWVLQVSKTSSASQSTQDRTLRPSWSRLTLRQPEDKKTVNTMLMVFDDSEELYTWLFALRKEIEHLGGIEYRPGTGNDDRTWRENLTRRFGPSSSEVRQPRRSSVEIPRLEYKTSMKENKDPHNTITTRRSRSQTSSTSSKQTNTSLERLRDSLTSNEYPPNLARVSATDSASSASPTTDCFPSIGSIADVPKTDLSLRAFSSTTGSRNGRSQSQPGRNSSLLERRKLSVNSLTLAQNDIAKPWKGLNNLPPTISGSPNDDAAQKQNLPVIPSVNLPENGLSLAIGSEASVERAETERHLQVEVQNHMRKPSQAETVSAKPKYTLFPVRSVQESKDEPLASPNELIKTTSPPRSRSMSRMVSRAASRSSNHEAKLSSKHRKSRSRTVTLELRQHRKSALLGVGQFDMPLRSPAVTDDMIMSNFGVKTQAVPQSPLPVSQVPGLADLTFNLEFLKMPYQQQTKRLTQGNHRSPSTRSVSSTYSDASAGVSKAPAGPPPVGPLPAVPQRSSQASGISQYSQHSNMSRYSSKKSTRQSKPSPSISENGLSRSELCVVESTGDEKPVAHKHSRTISSAINVPRSIEPSPPAYMSKKSFDETQKPS